MSVKATQSRKRTMKRKDGKAKYTIKTGVEQSIKQYTVIENGKEVIKRETYNRQYRIIVENPK